MAKQVSKLSRDWIKRMRADFKEFLEETHFPNPKRMGKRGPEFEYPEWLIMFIVILSVKCRAKNYLAIWRIPLVGMPMIMLAGKSLRQSCDGLPLPLADPISVNPKVTNQFR